MRVWFGRFEARLSPGSMPPLTDSCAGPTTTSLGADADALGLYATYALRNDAFVGARVDYGREEVAGEPARTRTRFEVNAGIGF